MLRSDRFQVAHDAEISVCTVPSTRYYRFCLRYDEHSLKFSLVIPTTSIRRRDRFSGSQLGYCGSFSRAEMIPVPASVLSSD